LFPDPEGSVWVDLVLVRIPGRFREPEGVRSAADPDSARLKFNN